MKSKTDTRNVALVALDPLVEFCNSNVGSKIELAERMTDALGYKIHRQIAEGWTHSDPARRVEPKLGQGIVLMHVGNQMMKAHKKKVSSRLNIGRIFAKGLNGSVHDKKARPTHDKKPKAPKPAKPSRPDLDLADAQSGVGVTRRKPKADVRKAIPPAKQFPAPPKPRKS